MALTLLTTFSLRTGLEVIENLYGFDLAETSDFPRNYKNYKKITKKFCNLTLRENGSRWA